MPAWQCMAMHGNAYIDSKLRMHDVTLVQGSTLMRTHSSVSHMEIPWSTTIHWLASHLKNAVDNGFEGYSLSEHKPDLANKTRTEHDYVSREADQRGRRTVVICLQNVEVLCFFSIKWQN